MAGINIEFLANVGKFLKGTKDVEEALDEVADSLDGMAQDAKKAANKAANSFDEIGDKADDGFEKAGKAAKDFRKDSDKALDGVENAASSAAEELETKFKDAFETVKDGSKGIGKDLETGINDGLDGASEGITEFKEESADSAREAAASFSGSFDDVGDLIQEVAANAFRGFGPAGMAAGIAAAAGIGAAIGKLQEMADEAAEAKDAAIDLARELRTVNGNPKAIDWAGRLEDKLSEIADTKEWWEPWQKEPVTALEELSDNAEKAGVSLKNMGAAYADIDSEQTEEFIKSLEEQARFGGEAGDAAWQLAEELRGQQEELAAATEMQKGYDEVLSDLEAEQAAAEAVATMRDSIGESLTAAGESWEQYTENGKVNLAEYQAAIEQQFRAVEQYETNMSTASQDLSAEALQYVQNMGIEAAPLLEAFVNAPADQKGRLNEIWTELGQTSTEGYDGSLEVDSKTQEAIKKSNATAKNNPVEFQWKFDASGLQNEVNQAAASIRPPVIHAQVVAGSPTM